MRRMLSRQLAAFALAVTLVIGAGGPAFSQQVLRDAEIENTIRTFATPIFQAAGLSPQAVTIYLIDDPQLNAFATAGQRIFLNSGFLVATNGPGEVIGVLAHESGHIAGGHINRLRGELETAQLTGLAATLLGVGAALLTGDPRAASAGSKIGGDLALKGLLQYTQSEENAADQAAVTYMTGAHQSPQGLLDFMRTLDSQRVLNAIRQDPYLSTHPLTDQRITFLQRAVAESPYKNQSYPPEWVQMHARMRAKLIGYLQSPEAVARTYPKSDDSLAARYARTISTYRNGSLPQALTQVDTLLAEHPADPFFHELKGQMLLENGEIDAAEVSYRRAVELLPEEPQLRTQLAFVQIQHDSREADEAALDNLSLVLAREPDDASAWRLAAIAHGRIGNQGMTALSMAEYNFARGNWRDARGQAERAKGLLSENSAGWLRAADIAAVAERNEERAERR